MQQNKQISTQDQEPDTKKERLVDQSRRKALKKMAAGGAVAGLLAVSGKWGKPVVNSLVLPAHAQATNPAPPTVTTTTTTTTPAPAPPPQGGGEQPQF